MACLKASDMCLCVCVRACGPKRKHYVFLLLILQFFVKHNPDYVDLLKAEGLKKVCLIKRFV